MKAKFFALAALVLGLASCQNDFDAANVGAGGEVDFQLSVNAPELATRAGENGADDKLADLNSAYGAIDYLQGGTTGDNLRTNWNNVDLRYVLEVYDVANGAIVGTAPVKDRQVIIVDEYQPVTFELRLVPKRNYRFVVFADFVEQGASDEASFAVQNELGLHHNLGNTLQEITVKRTEENAINNEVTDAYFAFKDFTITNSASNDIVLKRPYGKLRVIATDLHELNLNSNPDAVKVEYTALQPQTLNAVTGEIGAIENTVTTFVSEYNEGVCKEFDEKNGKLGLQNHFYNAGYDALNGANHKQYTNANGDVRHTHMTLFTDYILASEQQHSVHFTMTVYDDYANNSEIKSTTFNTDIPVQRNYLTTVIGNVLTTATEVEVRIDDNFAGEIVVDADIEDQLEEAAKKKNYVIDLDGDFIWETGAAHGSNPLIPEDAITETLTINGNGYKFIATGAGVGAIRLANGGKLILNDLTVVDQSEYHYEDGETAWEFTYLEFAGETEFNNCVIDNTISLDGTKAVFNNCTFNDKVTWPSNAGQEYAAWVSNGKAYFNNCSFSGARGIKVHEAYGTEVEEVVVDNCQFNNLSKKPGMAIGTVNAATKIEIKNSTFTNCQPGDQGLYIYETKTDVTTFDFTQTNNTVTAAIATSEEFAKITKADIHTLNIALAGDITVDVSANTPSYYFGGKNTNVITIDGAKVATTAATGAGDNTYTLTFNHKNTDWNYIRFNNDDAKWVIKNVKITNSGANNGPWNRHDIRFFNDVVLENVTSDKAIALLANGDLTNVIISDVHPNNSEAYALWITAEGQTVNLKNCALLAHESKTTDRGIKIDNQYVNDGEAKVTLNIDGLKVKSQKKAAIMVKSTKGADINIKNIDITEVAADKVNAVWVDEDTKAYAGLVTVTGASMIVEGQEAQIISTKESLKTALEAAGAAGAGNTTLILAKDAEIDMTGAEWTPIYVNGYQGADIVTVVGNGAILKGLTAPLFKGGFAGGSGIVIRDLTITESNIVSTSTQGSGAFIECADSMETITLENCHFTNSSISGSRTGGLIGWTSGYSNENDGPVKTYVTIKNCSVIDVDINATGSAAAINGHAGASDWTYTTIENCTVKNCNINSTDDGDWRTGVVVGTANVGEVTISNITESGNTLTQIGKTAPDGFKRNYYGRAVLGSTGKLSIDGYKYAAEGIFMDANNNVIVASQATLQTALSKSYDKILLLAGNYELYGLNFVANDVTLKGVDKANVVLNLEKSIYLQNKSVTLENLTYNLNAGKVYKEQDFAFVHHATAFNLKNCNVNRLRLNVYEANIEGCTFTLNTSNGFDGYCIYYYGNDGSTVNVKNSTFATAGKGICIYSESAKAYNLNVDKCSFTSSDSATDKAAIQMHTELGIYGNVKITETTATGFADINGGLWNELNNNTKVATDKFDIWVDGTQVH